MMILSKIKSGFLTLIFTGIHSGLTEREKLEVQLVNALAVLIALNNFFIWLYNNYSGNSSGLVNLSQVSIFPIVFSLQFFKKHELAKVAICNGIPMIMLIWISNGATIIEFDYFIIPYFILCLILFKLGNYLMYVTLLLNFLIFYYCYTTNYAYFENSEFTEVLGFAIILCIIIFTGVRFIEKYIDSLSEKNIQLKNQNQDLSKLIQQNQMKTELLSFIAHDIKGPSSAFDNLTSKIADLINNGEYEELMRISDYFEKSSKKLFYNIDHMLTWVISQKKGLNVFHERFHVKTMIKAIIDKLAVQYPKRVSEVEDLTDDDLYLKCDEFVLQAIFYNIMENSLKYSEVKNKILIRSMILENGLYQFSISNKGVPIDLGIVERIKNGDYEKSKMGYGLGVGICFSFIQTIGGELRYEALEDGTVAHITVPSFSA